MKKQLRNWFSNISLYHKILLVVTAVLICICTVFFVNLSYLTKRYDKELYQSNATALNHVSVSIAADLQAIETISSNIMIDSVIQKNLEILNEDHTTYESSLAKRDIYNALYPHAFYNSYVKSINIILADGTNICMGSTAYIEQFNKDLLHGKAQAAAGRVIWQPTAESGNDIAGARQIRELKYLKLNHLADLYIVVDMERLIKDALKDAGYPPETSRFLILSEQSRIYPESAGSTSLVYDAIAGEMISTGDHYRIFTDRQKKDFIISGIIPNTGWHYLYIRDYKPIFNEVTAIKFQVLFVCIGSAVLIFVLMRIIFAHILKHLDFLIIKIRAFGNGEAIPEDSKSYNYASRQDEIGQLHRNFDQMTRSVKVLRDENYDKQLLLREATIKMLQQQINPHFLYNTLDTINCMAESYGADEISTMVCALANLFRCSITGEEDVIPLEDELKVLENYIRIQEIRFRDRLHFTMTLPDPVSHIYVPKLCIQPLVENALKHALEYSDEICTIEVTVKETAEGYRITVANTGSQFDPDLLDRIEKRQPGSDGSGVGLSNIHSRMKLLYGDQYGLNFYNRDGMAIVMLRIPKERGH